MERLLTIVADDYGIGAETSRGILELAQEGRLSATVLMVNCPDAERSVRAWQAANPACDLGWHPNLTLDRPVCSPAKIPTLVQKNGLFWPLKPFLIRCVAGLVSRYDVEIEWRAQYNRFIELTGHPPCVINSHQHASIIKPCDQALLDLLLELKQKPYVRRVCEPWASWQRIRGARLKRLLLNRYGYPTSRQLKAAGFIGADALIGVTNPECVTDTTLWLHWLAALQQSRHIELCCHPGYWDSTLLGRDVTNEKHLARRPLEWQTLHDPQWHEHIRQLGLKLVRPSQLQK